MTESEERYAFMHELGCALQQWSMVEGGLHLVVRHCCRFGPEAFTLVTGLLAIDSFRSKVEYTDALLRARYFPNAEIEARWKSLSKQLGRLAVRRNKLAHWQIVGIGSDELGKRMALVDPRTQAFAATPEEIRKSLFIRDVAELRDVFDAMHKRLHNFASFVAGMPPSHPEPPEVIAKPSLASIEQTLRRAVGARVREGAPAASN